jgi:2-polyprenyl-6-methoxyphenol hydroxylase-like FAD-dependent oxidoreductase
MDLTTQVAVVGGGPAGLAAAIELGRHGVRCVVVEPRTRIDADRPRAKTTSCRSMELMRRWGIADRLRAAAPMPPGWSRDVLFTTNLLGAEISRFTDVFGLQARERGDACEDGLQVPQPVVERVLREVAGELPTVDLRIGVRAERVVADVDGVTVHLSGPPGVVRADYVIGADGSTGVCRSAVGASYQGSSGEIPNISVVFEAPGLFGRLKLDAAVQYWVINRTASGLMGRLDGGDRWWAIIQQVDVREREIDAVALVRALIGPAGADLAVDVVSIDPWVARMLLADTYRRDRIFLVGDAAHLNPPWGGHGFNTAIGDAVNLGWKLAAVLAGWGGPGLLDSYEPERRPVAALTIADAAAQQALLAPSFVSDGLAAGAAERVAVARKLRRKEAEFHSEGLVLGYHYAGSPIVLDDGSAVPDHDPVHYHRSGRPGMRLPHALLPDGRPLFDRLGRGLTVLASQDAPFFGAAAAARGVPLDVVEVPAYVLVPAALVLVRPDQHVAWRGPAPRNVRAAGDILDVVRGVRTV